MLPSAPAVVHALILEGDRIYAQALECAVMKAFPTVKLRIVGRIESAFQLLTSERFNLLVTNVQLPDGDAIDALAAWQKDPRIAGVRALVVTARREIHVLQALAQMGEVSVFDPASEEPEQLDRALRATATGKVYWSSSLASCVIASRHSARTRDTDLTPTERVILAIIGDGCDDAEAAARLGMRRSTIVSARRALHRKIGVQHKGDLVRAAIQQGYVSIHAGGVVRPGFSLLLAAKRSRGSA